MHIPSATYRIQLNQEFNFEQLQQIIDYLHALGVSTIYAAPIGNATPGSMHGYDVTDPNRINPEIGTFGKLRELSKELAKKSMQWLQDIVPNHMAFSPYNRRLMDVLERGSVSPYYSYFDINWNHHNPLLRAKVMVPFLGKPLENAIADKEIKVTFSERGLTLSYFDDHYPVSYYTYQYISSQLSVDNELAGLLEKIQNSLQEHRSLTDWQSRRKEWVDEIYARKLQKNLLKLCEQLNSDSELLSYIVNHQFYILCHWKVTEKEINYRRFFTVNSLICLSMEREDVFDEYHKMIAVLYNESIIHGVRIDHIDGLNDPENYVQRLRTLLGDDCYIVAEKILEAEEKISSSWSLQGTSGYEFLAYLNKLLTDRHGAEELIKFYRTLVPDVPRYDELVLTNKKLILEKHMAGELDNLVEYFIALRIMPNISREKAKAMLEGLMLALPVYRIYPHSIPLTGENEALMQAAFERALGLTPNVAEELKAFRSVCFDKNEGPDVVKFLKRMMQFTGPLTAKGVEDTTFYIYNPLISHDEVGDAPNSLGAAIQTFHKRMIWRRENTPLSLNATATHDTKRGEDARLRLNALTEFPKEWIMLVKHWIAENQKFKVNIEGVLSPVVNDEYFIYQSILGGFPEDMKVSKSWVNRLKDYLVKVVREAKVRSNWENPNEEYEDACTSFITALLSDNSEFMKTFLPFAAKTIKAAAVTSLAQVVAKITCPGIPDIYQGCELWDLSYVDPDNRRPVDYALRTDLLQRLQAKENAPWEEFSTLLEESEDVGIKKMFVTYRCLHLRKRRAELFLKGAYLPLALLGTGQLAVAFARYLDDQWCLVVIPFHVSGKSDIKAELVEENFISLPSSSPTTWRNIFTNERIEAAEGRLPINTLLANFPVAVLMNDL